MSIGEVTLSNHPFTLMLGGHPQAISLAAPMLEYQTLTELFQQLLESNIMDALGYQEKQSYTSLRLSLEISIKNIKKKNSEALDLFMLIGLLPGGIKQPELTELYGSPAWKPLKENLIRASLLVYKPAENMLTLLPFMNTRAFELLEEDENKKTEFHLKCCKFYKEFCAKYLNQINDKSFKLNEFVECESNIWACIYRGINRKKDNNEYDEEEEASGFMMMHSMNDTALNSFQDHFNRRASLSTNKGHLDAMLLNNGVNLPNEIIHEEKDSNFKEEEDDSEEH